MHDEEKNSAEAEAEQILRDAARTIQTEECPQGEECAVHHRVEEAFRDEKAQYARYISYCGDYVIITEDNLELESPSFILRAILGMVTKDDIPPRWETTVFLVGSDGTIGTLSDASPEVRKEALRYIERHDDWDALRSVHETVVSALQAGLIDTSTPIIEDGD